MASSTFSIQTVFRATDLVSSTMDRMASNVASSANRIEGAFTGVARATGGVTLALGGVAVSGGLATAALADADVRAQQLAKSVGASVDTMEALTAASSSAGFEFDNIIDLVEEMNNKFGESAGLGEALTPVKESLQILGLSFEDIQKLDPESQFLRIADAALKLDDAQKAAAASDILLGGEANKLIGVWRQQGKSIDEVIDRFQELNFRSQESRQGAGQLARQVGQLSFAFTSFFREVAGLFGASLAPELSKLTMWLRDNRPTVEAFMRSFVSGAVEVAKAVRVGVLGAIEDLKASDMAKWFSDLNMEIAQSRVTFRDVTELVSAFFKTLSAGIQIMVLLAATSVTLRVATVALTVATVALTTVTKAATIAMTAWSVVNAALPSILAAPTPIMTSRSVDSPGGTPMIPAM